VGVNFTRPLGPSHVPAHPHAPSKDQIDLAVCPDPVRGNNRRVDQRLRKQKLFGEAAMRILVAVDGSNSSEAVIQEAARRPWSKGSEFRVVTVVDPFFFTRAPLLLEEAKKNTIESLEEQTKPLVEAGWPVTADVILDNPRHALPRAASTWGAELILLGSHGRGAVGRLLLGSTAQAVLRHAKCSVEIVRQRGKDENAGVGMRVLIPTDGSEHADAALRSAAERPWPDGSEFRIISSPEFPVVVGEYPYYPSQHVDELSKSGREHANESARSGQDLLSKAGLKVTSEVTEVRDSPAQAILAAADEWKADLIVMGSHGRRGFDRLILGSVSETVALHAACSVEVIRKPLAVL
jgi:nucleotide-binding universal stress UspA family protein